MATPINRRIIVESSIEIFETSNATVVAEPQLEEYQVSMSTTTAKTSLASDYSRVDYTNSLTIPPIGSQVDGWSSYWNPGVKWNNCDMLWSLDGALGAEHPGKTFNDFKNIRTTPNYVGVFESSPVDNSGIMDIMYVKSRYGTLFYTANNHAASGNKDTDFKIKFGEHCFHNWQGRSWPAGNEQKTVLIKDAGAVGTDVEHIVGIRKL